MTFTLTPFDATMNGGSDLLGYELQVDDGKTGPFVTVLGAGLSTPHLMSLETSITLSNLTKGSIYRA